MKALEYLKLTMKKLQHAPAQYDREIAEIIECIADLEALQQSKSCECLEDVIFVWNETSNFIESIVLNTEDLALDVSKSYKVCIVELKEQLDDTRNY